MMIRFMLAIVLLGLGITASASADTLLIDQIAHASTDQIDRPARGLSMSQVEAAYGPPLVKKAPVGQPPITRWEYDGFVVFFEGETVLHSVIKRKPGND